MSKMFWEATFKLANRSEVEAVQRFLRAKLDRTRVKGFRVRENFVMLQANNEDAIFTAGQWVRYNNPLGQLLFYNVKGYDKDGRLTFDSGCPVCREARQEGRILEVHHYAHRIAGKCEAKMISLGAGTVEDNRIALPAKVRKALNVKEHDHVSFLQRYGRVILEKKPITYSYSN